jgi:hypothetical protein
MNKTEIFPARHEKLGRFALGRKSKRKANDVAQGFRYAVPHPVRDGIEDRISQENAMMTSMENEKPLIERLIRPRKIGASAAFQGVFIQLHHSHVPL